ncbi:MAG: chitobiase/beta-hexosaminidase C-terminal domain-containing protein [Chitinispirillaceae bacterium]|nr:chitobiase/beta-hexosaminidase C-terminal domain-containing protein [Chitinispirillaceae bacterium]
MLHRSLPQNLLFLLLAALLPASAKPPVPEWLDTIAPVVTIAPRQKWHRSLFKLTLSASEPSQLWIAKEKPKKMKRYDTPIPVEKDGIWRFYFYGEDDFGNRSPIDSIVYILDTKPPALTVDPSSGTYRKNSTVHLRTGEPSRFFFTAHRGDSLRETPGDSLLLRKALNGFVVAVDSAGNRTWSDSLSYTIDTSEVAISIAPEGGIYRASPMVTLTVPEGTEGWYSFDPLAPPEWFVRYTEPLYLPHGLTIVRYFARTPSGTVSSISRESYVVDTIPPKLVVNVRKGSVADTITFGSKEKVTIRFTSDGSIPNEGSQLFSKALVVEHRGISRLKAKAWDQAGNISPVVTWEYKYDHQPPEVSAHPRGGTFNTPVTVTIMANEPARILYTINGKPTENNALVYSEGGIHLTREGVTELRYMGVDEAENNSEEKIERYVIDVTPPEVQARIQGDIATNQFFVTLQTEQGAKIHFTVNGGDPNPVSPVYSSPVQMKTGDVLRYIARDTLGNTSRIYLMDDLERPMVEAKPPAGVFNRRLRISFDKTFAGTVWWRLLPDTVFRSVLDTIVIDKEGMHTFEYFMETTDGIRSAIRRNEYFLDWTPPRVTVRTQKGVADSAIVFFDANENSSIYYTFDGTNPLFSTTTRSAGNKFQRSSDRITLLRRPDTRLAWYAEDAAGNQSALSILDVFRPRVIPNIPAGTGRVHDRILSLTLQSQEGAVIHYERHGKKPAMQSPIFTEPLTLLASDTIVAFVVDPSGYRGDPDTFVYLIDLPPSPQFLVSPDTIWEGATVTFDASGTIDRESPPGKLLYSWDYVGDGTFDTKAGYFPRVSHTYGKSGAVTVTVKVTDERKREATFKKDIFIRERCPEDMVATFDEEGKALCMDRYEWPNRKGKQPLTSVSWVEAKMLCIDAGKRLCSASEWRGACRNKTVSMYPYGDNYDPRRCATEEAGPLASGSKPECSAGGTDDMVGNVWEWVEDKKDDFVQAYGGSFRYGKDGHCTLTFEGTVATRSNETGFRCCK